ncbi:MAG: ABC transporter ATP-binding protein [Candidatus Bathyarchaeota archaeon]|nr:MAG: ABC transporter ATP-binding protein [Candidatus Bathyarchaeota archaeon]
MALLEVKNLKKSFGGIQAVNDCSFKIEDGCIYGLIGPNGSGKTTIFNLITGFYKEDSGDIFFRGERINGLKPYQRTERGIGRTFQLVRVFRKMKVLDNLLVPPHLEKLDKETRLQKAIDLLKFVELERLKDELAENLSFGQQRLLEFAIVLMQDPDLILLDEPTSGVNPALIKKMCDNIKQLCKEGKTFLIIEHNIPAIMDTCGTVIVLDYGRKIAEGSGADIAKDERVIEAYLGAGAEVHK